MTEKCFICHGESGAIMSPMADPISWERVCMPCLEDLLRQDYLRDLDSEDLAELKDRVIEVIAGDAGLLIEVAAKLAARGVLEIEDLL